MGKKLTIGIVTMNREEQLAEALYSCLRTDLPNETEFVVIDNASTDNTEKIVKEILTNSGYEYYYEKLPENIGCGRGRNYAFSKSCGSYYYSLDDDAVIDEHCKDFFLYALDILDKNTGIVTLTTQIYDTAWKSNRLDRTSVKLEDDLYECKMFCGGSHFLRRDFFKEAPYFSNRYGYEEIPASLYVVDAGCKNVFCSAIRIIHNPKVNKWNCSDEKNHTLFINECVLQYVIKSAIYPKMVKPILYMAYKARCWRHLKHVPNWKQRTNDLLSQTKDNAKSLQRIRLRTVIELYKKFGNAIF